MTMNAKFASTCPTCGQRIDAGSPINWTPGSKARHTGCIDELEQRRIDGAAMQRLERAEDERVARYKADRDAILAQRQALGGSYRTAFGPTDSMRRTKQEMHDNLRLGCP